MPSASFERGFEYRSSRRTQAERNQQANRPKKIRRRDGMQFTVIQVDETKKPKG